MIGYWLLPAEPERSWFAAAIEKLARRYDAPVFEPHVTLYSDDADEQAARDLIERVAARHAPVVLAVSETEFSEKFTKTLFVQFVKTADAQRLSDAIRAASQSRQEHKFNPHLSLLYARIPDAAKAMEAAAIRLPFDRLLFDSLAAVEFPRPIESRADVEAWRTIGSVKLGGSSAPRSI